MVLSTIPSFRVVSTTPSLVCSLRTSCFGSLTSKAMIYSSLPSRGQAFCMSQLLTTNAGFCVNSARYFAPYPIKHGTTNHTFQPLFEGTVISPLCWRIKTSTPHCHQILYSKGFLFQLEHTIHVFSNRRRGSVPSFVLFPVVLLVP